MLNVFHMHSAPDGSLPPPLGPSYHPVKVSSPYSDDYRATHTSDPPTVPPNKDSPPTRVTPQPQPPPTTQPQPPAQQPHMYPILPGREGEEIPYYTGGQYPQPTYPRQQRVNEHTRLVNHWAGDSVTVTCPHWTECMVLVWISVSLSTSGILLFMYGSKLLPYVTIFILYVIQ